MGLLPLDASNSVVEGSATSLLKLRSDAVVFSIIHGVGGDQVVCILAVPSSYADLLIVEVSAQLYAIPGEAGDSWSWRQPCLSDSGGLAVH